MQSSMPYSRHIGYPKELPLMAFPANSLNNFAQLVSKQEVSLRSQHHTEHEPHGNNHCEDFDDQLEETNAAWPSKGFPGLKHTDFARAADNSGSDLTAEGAVERDNSLILLREHRCGNADCSDGRGNLNEDEEGKREGEDDKGLAEDDRHVFLSRLECWILEVLHSTERAAEQYGEAGGDLSGQRTQSNRRCNLSPGSALERWHPLPPLLWAWLRDDNLVPSKFPPREYDLGNDSGNSHACLTSHDGYGCNQGDD